MKSKLLCGVCMLVILMGLSACAKWEPEVSGDEAASGSAVATEHTKPMKKGKEPDMEEVKQAYHFAVQNEVYQYGGKTRDGFTSRKLDVYRKEEKTGISYYLVDLTDKKEHFYCTDLLYFNWACEEPGFESYVDQFGWYSEKDKTKALKGAKKMGSIPSWKFSSHEKPLYPELSQAAQKQLDKLEKKVSEDAKEYLACSTRQAWNVCIPYFTPADREVSVFLNKDKDRGQKCSWLLEYNLGDDICLNRVYDDVEDNFSPMREFMEIILIQVPVKKLSDFGFSEDTVKQLQRIRSERKKWITSIQDEAYSSGIWYMISDLNQNGRLEVVAEMSCGSGGFINRRAVYEVSEDGKSLIKYKVTDPETAMELAASGLVTVDAYWDERTGIYYYAGENYTNPDGYRFGYSPGCFYLKDKECQEEYMKVYREKSKEDGSLTYFNRKDKKITKDEYKRIQKEFWQGKEKRKAQFYWQKADTILEEEDADVDLLLAKSWKKFSVE